VVPPLPSYFEPVPVFEIAIQLLDVKGYPAVNYELKASVVLPVA